MVIVLDHGAVQELYVHGLLVHKLIVYIVSSLFAGCVHLVKARVGVLMAFWTLLVDVLRS